MTRRTNGDMKFDLMRPCAHCLFAATDRSACVARAVRIAAALFRRDLSSPVTEQLAPQHCADALILHEKLGRPKWRIPFAARWACSMRAA
jgi:hypothetical protein